MSATWLKTVVAWRASMLCILPANAYPLMVRGHFPEFLLQSVVFKGGVQ